MTKRSRVILAVVTLAALAGIAWSILKPGPPDPVYDGHPLSYWVAGGPWGTWKIPSGLDSNAVPYLIQSLKSRDGLFRKAYINLYPRFPAWVRNRLSYPVPAEHKRSMAARLLGSMGSTARPAIPDLVHIVKADDNYYVRRDAINALRTLAYGYDAAVIECLKAASKDKDSQFAIMADQALDYIYLKDALEPGSNDAKIP
jgi:hypothetical protein